MDPNQLLSQGLNTGVLALAVWYIAKKLASQYESRISALEAEVKDCHADRKAVNERFIEYLTQKTSHSDPASVPRDPAVTSPQL